MTLTTLMNIQLKNAPLKINFHFTMQAHKHGMRPNMKETANELAKFLLENGYITMHGPHLVADADAYEYIATIYAYKPERGLP